MIKMSDNQQNDIAAFLGGSLATIFGYIHGGADMLQQSLLQVNWNWHVWVFDTALKVTAAMLVAVFGGFAGLLAKDVYKWAKRKYFTSKK